MAIQLNQTPPDQNNLANIRKLSDQNLKKEAEKLKRQYPNKGIDTNESQQKTATEILKETAPQRKPAPSYYSVFWTSFTNPRTEAGKQTRNTFLGLLLADAVITGGGGLLYGVSKNGSNMDLINDLHNFISEYSETLKLCAEIIPPSILFISIIILLAGVKAEKNHADLIHARAQNNGAMKF